MSRKDYKAMLSAVEEAIAIYDRSGPLLDAAHRNIREDLVRVQAELMSQIEGPASDPS